MKKRIEIMHLRATGLRLFVTAALWWTLCPCTPVLAEWYRGNTHSHTTESDGDSSPSVVTAWYHDQGYHFLLLTDHNKLVDPATVPMPANPRDDFILIPGEEISGNYTIHTTAMNIDSLADWTATGTKTEVIQGHVHEARAHGGEAILNHPNFTYALSATDIQSVTNLYMFELFNGHPSVHNHGDALNDSTEEIWDELLTSGMRVCAVAADDVHHLQGVWAMGRSNPGRGWVMVNADQLTPDDITAAMTNGDFYASSGVFFDTYEPVHDRYSIRVDTLRTQEELAKAFALGHRRSDVSAGWTLQFIGANGSVLSETNATSADYLITGDPPYVRAKATYAREVAPGDFECFYAWGQPVYPGDPLPADFRILGNGLTISDADLTPDSILGTDFGVTTQSLTHTFTITNQSEATTLDLTNTPRVTVTADPGNFITLSQDASVGSLLPGSNTTFEVTYSPSSQGTHTALVSVASTDATYPLYSFAIAGLRPGPPSVTNEGVSAIVANRATLSGRLTGGELADAWFLFGTSDGGTNDPANWDSPYPMGSVSQGEPLSVDVNSLLYDVAYSYRVYASNRVGTAWSDVVSFVIPQPTWELIAQYALENNYDDSSGNGFHGAVIGNGVLTNHAQRGRVYCNPDNASRVDIEATSPMPNLPANRNITVAAWVKPEESGVFETTMSLGRGGDFPIMQMGVNDWGLHGYIEGDGDQVILDGTDNTVPQGVWTHTAIVCDRVNDIASLYVNGQLDVTYNISSVGDGELDWHFASLMGTFEPAVARDPLVGCIDDAHIYYDALDAVAVSNLYAGILDQKPIFNTAAANITTNTAELLGTLNAPQSEFSVYVYYGTNDNADAATWLGDGAATNLWIGTYTNVTRQSVAGSVSSLSVDTTYYYTMVATNSATNIWARPNVSFRTQAPPSAPAVGNAGGATALSATTATLRGELTAGGSANAWICWGPAGAGGDTSSTGTWQNVVAIHPAVSTGDVFSDTASGLYFGLEYTYAVYVTNAVDDAWSSVTNFITVSPTVSGPGSYRDTVLADSPLVYYAFDETNGTTAANSGTLGASHNGTLDTAGGSVTLNQASFQNGGTSYDFGGGHVEAAALPSSLTEWTLEAWINWDSAKSTQSHIFGNDQGGWNDDVLFGIGAETGSLGVPSANIGCIQQGAPGTTRDVVTEPLSHNEWHHVVASGSAINGELKLFVDGTLRDTDSAPVNGLTLNGADGIGSALIAVGASRADGLRPFDGLIDEFALYGSVLDATTIARHYEAGTAASSADVLLVDIDIDGTTSGTVLNQSGTEVIAIDPTNNGDIRMTVNGSHLTQADGVAIAVPTALGIPLPRQVINATGELTTPGITGFPGIWFSTTDISSDGSEANYDFSVAHFPFAGGWISGTVDQNGNLLAGNPTGVTITKRSGPGVNAGNYALDIAGVNPATDGYLFTIGAQNENSGNYAPTRIQPDHSGWDITISDQGGDAANGTNGEDNPWSFVYLPETVQHLVAGRIDEDATVLDGVGSFSVTVRPTIGEYLLKIPDGSGGFLGKDDGVLLLNVTKDVAPVFDGADDNFLLQAYSSTNGGFIVASHDLDSANDQTTQWSFAFLRFDAPPFIPFTHAVTNTVATNITASTADLLGTLDAYQAVFTVYAFYSTNDNADAAAWLSDSTATNLAVGTYTNVVGQPVTGSVASLSADTTYYYTLMTTNAATNIWASSSRSFTTPAASGVTINYAVPYSWLLGIDSSWSNDFEAAALRDPDGDGFDTGEEYWSGTDPTDPDSRLKIDSIVYGETNVVLQWRHAAIDQPIPAIQVQHALGNVTGVWNTVDFSLPFNGINRWTNAPPSESFYRLKANVNP